MTASELRKLYFQTLGLDCSAEKKKLRLAAFTRACERRDFEIEHYWKRATYFWAFQVAIFAAFGLLWKTDAAPGDWGPITILLAALGVLTAVTNTLSAHGSGFWQQNWEYHIDMLEDEFEGHLYKTVWLQKGKVSYSVSRVNQSLSYYFVVFWGLVFLYAIWRFLKAHSIVTVPLDCWPKAYALVVVVALVVGIFILLSQTSNFSSRIPQTDGSLVPIQPRSWWKRWRRRICVVAPPFIHRYAPGEKPPST